MTCQEYELHIDDYVDGILNEPLRASCDTHLAGCVACRALTTDLQTIRHAVQTLEPQVPSPQVWYRLEAAIEAEPRGLSPLWLGGWQRAAAGAVMSVLIVGSLSWIGARLSPMAFEQGRLASGIVSDSDPLAVDDAEFTAVERQYTSAITGLETITRDQRSALDMETADVLQANMTVIDGAINDSRAALRREPGSSVAQDSLFEALRSKVALLQDTVTLINEMRQSTDSPAGIPSGQNQ
jgi:hypothetical protein